MQGEWGVFLFPRSFCCNLTLDNKLEEASFCRCGLHNQLQVVTGRVVIVLLLGMSGNPDI